MNGVRPLRSPRPRPAALIGLATAVALSLTGIVAMRSTAPGEAAQQVRWLAVGLVMATLCFLPNPRTIGRASMPLLLFHLLVLAIMLAPFTPASLVPTINGARSWINLAGNRFQPSETAKVAYVLAVAWRLRHALAFRRWRGLLLELGLMALPVGLIIKQPDLGSALLFGPTLLLMLLVAGARLSHLGVLAGGGALAVAAVIASVLLLPPSMQALKPHQQVRIRALVAQVQGDTRYVQDAGYQQDKAMTLIGAGGVTGYGRDASAQVVSMNDLPEEHNDMIFVVIVNRWGLAGGLAVLAGYTLIIGSLLRVAAVTKDPFARLAVVGFAAMIFSQVTINVGVAVGLLPVTGLTLPFISAGGSSLMAMFIMLGIAANCSSRPPLLLAKPSFEFTATETRP